MFQVLTLPQPLLSAPQPRRVCWVSGPALAGPLQPQQAAAVSTAAASPQRPATLISPFTSTVMASTSFRRPMANPSLRLATTGALAPPPPSLGTAALLSGTPATPTRAAPDGTGSRCRSRPMTQCPLRLGYQRRPVLTPRPRGCTRGTASTTAKERHTKRRPMRRGPRPARREWCSCCAREGPQRMTSRRPRGSGWRCSRRQRLTRWTQLLRIAARF